MEEGIGGGAGERVRRPKCLVTPNGNIHAKITARVALKCKENGRSTWGKKHE